MVVFHIERRGGLPAYLQIVRQVELALRMGALTEGDKLPTAAQVAAATKVNPNTTLKAYRELERAGLVEVRQGAGTFVTHAPDRPRRSRSHGCAAASPPGCGKRAKRASARPT